MCQCSRCGVEEMLADFLILAVNICSVGITVLSLPKDVMMFFKLVYAVLLLHVPLKGVLSYYARHWEWVSKVFVLKIY